MWSWTAPAAGDVTISITSSGFPSPPLGVFTGESLAMLQPVVGDSSTDSENRGASQFRFVAMAGERYSIAVGYLGGDGSYTLKIAQSEPPAVAVTSPASGARILSGTDMILSADATDSDGEIPRVEFFLDFDFTPAGVVTNRPFQLELNSASLSVGAHRLRVRATDDFGLSTFSKEVPFRVVLPAPSNDDFANRTALIGPFVIVNGSNGNAPKEPDEPRFWAASESGSIWWTWKAPASGSVTLGTGWLGSTVLAVFIGDTVTNLTLVATNSSFGQFPAPQLAFTVVAGTEFKSCSIPWKATAMSRTVF